MKRYTEAQNKIAELREKLKSAEAQVESCRQQIRSICEHPICGVCHDVIPQHAIAIVLSFHISGYTNTHDGYCSDNECELVEYNNTPKSLAVLVSPEIHKRLGCRRGIPDDVAWFLFGKELSQLETELSGNQNGSYYCRNSSTTKGTHDIDLTFHTFTWGTDTIVGQTTVRGRISQLELETYDKT
jgi:hypothetical protein